MINDHRDRLLQGVREAHLFICIMNDLIYQRHLGMDCLLLAMELRKPVIMIADQHGKLDELPLAFHEYTGRKALVTAPVESPECMEQITAILEDWEFGTPGETEVDVIDGGY